MNLLIDQPETLEEFIENQCGMITPGLLKLLNPHREFIETALKNYYSDPSDWDCFIEMMWNYLPHPKNEHFRP